MELYHGSHKNTDHIILHHGICLCESEDVAEKYAQGGTVYQVDLDDSGLNVVEVPGYDHESNDCPADDVDYRQQMADEGADVLAYEDEDEMGREHTCYRLISSAALEAATAPL